MFRKQTLRVHLVKHANFKIVIELDVEGSNVIQTMLHLVFLLLIIVCNPALHIKACHVLEYKPSNMVRHAHEFLLIFTDQLLVPH